MRKVYPLHFGCQPDEPLVSLVTTNRIINVYGFQLIHCYPCMLSHCLYYFGNKITTTATTSTTNTMSWCRHGMRLCSAWWRHQMETFSALLALCAGNSPVPGEFPTQKPVTRSFDVFFDLRLNKLLSKQSLGWWFETLSPPFWRQCNGLRWPDPAFSIHLLQDRTKEGVRKRTCVILRTASANLLNLIDFFFFLVIRDIYFMFNVWYLSNRISSNIIKWGMVVKHGVENLDPCATWYNRVSV